MSEVVRIRAPKRLLVTYGVPVVVVAAPLVVSGLSDGEFDSWLRSSWLLAAVLWGAVLVRSLARPDGVDPTDDVLRIVGPYRTREIPWRDVRDITLEGNLRIHRATGRPARLVYPRSSWLVGRRRVEQDHRTIERWWLAHGGAGRRPPPEPATIDDVWRAPPEGRW